MICPKCNGEMDQLPCGSSWRHRVDNKVIDETLDMWGCPICTIAVFTGYWTKMVYVGNGPGWVY